MRILALSHIFPPAVDGGSQVIYNLATGLKKYGHQVHFLSSDYSSTDDFTKHFLFRPFRKLGLPTGPFLSIAKIFLAIRFKPDWIIAGPLPTTTVWYARLIQIFSRSKVFFLCSFHESDPRFYSKVITFPLRYFHLWAQTDFEYNLLSRFSPNIAKHPIGILKNQIISKKTPQTITHNLLFLGSLAAHKGFEVLIKAHRLLPSNYKLKLLGQNTLFSEKIGISGHKYTEKEKLEALDWCDLLVLPSSQESFGIVLLEAGSRGKPFLALDIPTSKELALTTKAGYLYSPQTPQSLKNKIIEIFKNRFDMHKKGESGLKFVKTVANWDNISKWANHYLSSH